MGVPALFRWLSKKYPKIIYPVEEEEGTKMTGENGEDVEIPLNMALPNPNGVEFDNLYLDMNGIVHPCTHPEGKPPPETEEQMMVEIFNYTERVVNMIRPRKLLFMAIDGVAPRAKMNQQRSRRFRSAKEAEENDKKHEANVIMWKSLGKEISEEEEHKKSWDTNAITPGTPFMSLLAASLRYWVVQKMNTDPGWKNIQVLISDASVPGEGEHKIMDYIRRQRSQPDHDPNTRHVIYGLDADLIMLALATHEAHFRVLREDVFGDQTTGCRKCGAQDHYAAQCTAPAEQIQKKPPPAKKPFIFLDVSILREYLEVELDVPEQHFPFSLEQAIDDWVLLIFFVGNDFLPHLPSLEIREGAIDTLLKIWKFELSRMGGYMTNHGSLELARAQIILEGLAKREDEIFRRRHEAENRQDENHKRRKIEMSSSSTGPSTALALTTGPTAPLPKNPTSVSLHPSLPRKPAMDFAAKADSIGLGAKPTTESLQVMPAAAQALAGSNHDIVANRRAIRMANMSAAEVLKAELSGLTPLKASSTAKNTEGVESSKDSCNTQNPDILISAPERPDSEMDNAGEEDADGVLDDVDVVLDDVDADTRPSTPIGEEDNILAGAKRSFDEGPGEVDDQEDFDQEDEPIASSAAVTPGKELPPSVLALKVQEDGVAVQEDFVRLWEPGYKERYYRQKFGVELGDLEFRRKITTCYMEGLCWVLQYYYQGTPSWQWYYPYHFAPFAVDFEDAASMDIKFNLGQPFKPFEQLMGVFPASSRKHIPSVFHDLMTAEDSSIIDFYPNDFQIDMNGKRMAWQGVALLPFIDEKRLLDAMAAEYPNITDDEKKRNLWGNDILFCATDHQLYPFYEALYGKRKNQDPVPIDTKLSYGMAGFVLPNPECLPGSTYYCNLSTQNLPDITNDRSLSVLYFFPKQLTPHRSFMLPGTKPAPRVLTPADLEFARNGGRRGRGGRFGGGGRGQDRGSRNNSFHARPNDHYSYGNDRNGSFRNGYREDSSYHEGGGGGYGSARGYGGRNYNGRSQYGGQEHSYMQNPFPPSYDHGRNDAQGQHGRYGGHAPPRGGYGRGGGGGHNSYGNGPRDNYSAPPNSYGSYGNGGQSNGGGYGGYGGGRDGGGNQGGYGGYGGYGGGTSYSGQYGRGGAPYGGQSRGRGRGY